MNKSDVIDAMAKITGNSKVETEKHLEAFLSVVTSNISKSDGVKIIGFGTFGTSLRKARSGRNPKTGAEITIPERYVPTFKPGKDLKEGATSAS